jgi:hypothetical protein
MSLTRLALYDSSSLTRRLPLSFLLKKYYSSQETPSTNLHALSPSILPRVTIGGCAEAMSLRSCTPWLNRDSTRCSARVSRFGSARLWYNATQCFSRKQCISLERDMMLSATYMQRVTCDKLLTTLKRSIVLTKVLTSGKVLDRLEHLQILGHCYANKSCFALRGWSILVSPPASHQPFISASSVIYSIVFLLLLALLCDSTSRFSDPVVAIRQAYASTNGFAFSVWTLVMEPLSTKKMLQVR